MDDRWILVIGGREPLLVRDRKADARGGMISDGRHAFELHGQLFPETSVRAAGSYDAMQAAKRLLTGEVER